VIKELFHWRTAIPCLATIVAWVAGVLSILMTVRGMVTGQPEFYRWGALLVLSALVFDGLDGNLARWLKGQSEFGAELDTFVDVTAFGVAPAVLVHAVTLQEWALGWRLLFPCYVALFGALRLARFKVIDPSRGMGGYTGLPITVNAIWVSLYVLAMIVPPAQGLSGYSQLFFLFGVLSLTALQLSSVRYPAFSKKAVYFIPGIGMICFLVLLNFLHPRLAQGWAMLLAALCLIYALAGPWAMIKINGGGESADKTA